MLNWFKALSAAGKSGVIIASILGIGTVTAVSNNNQPTPSPAPSATNSTAVSTPATKVAPVITYDTITTTESIPFTTNNIESPTLAHRPSTK